MAVMIVSWAQNQSLFWVRKGIPKLKTNPGVVTRNPRLQLHLGAWAPLNNMFTHILFGADGCLQSGLVAQCYPW